LKGALFFTRSFKSSSEALKKLYLILKGAPFTTRSFKSLSEALKKLYPILKYNFSDGVLRDKSSALCRRRLRMEKWPQNSDLSSQ